MGQLLCRPLAAQEERQIYILIRKLSDRFHLCLDPQQAKKTVSDDYQHCSCTALSTSDNTSKYCILSSPIKL